jgi:phospholipase A1/A2
MRQLKYLTLLLISIPLLTIADDSPQLQQCLQTHVLTAGNSLSIGELKKICEELTTEQTTLKETPVSDENPETDDADQHPFAKRLNREALNRSSRFILTPHKRNYFYPVSHSRAPNTDPYQNTDSPFSELDHTEAELQLSIKILLRESIFNNNGHLYLGYTNHSFWQVYSDKDSAPFRATDHQPEFILSFTNDWKILGFNNSANQLILNHQSNGTGGILSRSWNRIMMTSIFERNNFVFSLSPWYRIPEPKQEYPGDPDGDDNPDITHFMGKFEFSSAYTRSDNIYSLMLRNNFDADNKGAIELGWSFPVSENLRGQFNYFNGYGHSLIDYNKDLEVFTLGIIFTDLF